MKIVFLTGAGANQKALANRLHAETPLIAILQIKIKAPKKGRSLFTRAISISIGLPLRHAWKKLFRYYDAIYSALPAVPVSSHEGVNALSVLELVRKIQPDLILVSGTDLLHQPLISATNAKIMNLHTGISPYVKGGPNCTNWCLATGDFDLIGNTIMWLDAGIDSGNIIATEQTPINGRESLADLHQKVMDHAHDLYVRCVKAYVGGADLSSVPQAELGEGRLFLTKHWTALQIAKATLRFYTSFGPKRLGRKKPVLVPLANQAW